MKPRLLQRLFLLLMDAALLDAGYWVAFGLRFSWAVPGRNWETFLAALPFISVLALILVWTFPMEDDTWSRPHPTGLLSRVMTIVVLLNLGTMVLTFWLRGFAFPRTVFLLAPLLQALFLTIWRLSCRRIQSSFTRSQRIAVLGLNGDAARVAAELTGVPPEQISVLHVEQLARSAESDADHGEGEGEGEGESEGEGKGEQRPGGGDLPPALVEALSRADAVFATSSLASPLRQAVTAWCLAHDRHLFLISSVYDLALQGANLMQVGDRPVLELSRLSLAPWQQAVKRTGDLVLAIIVGSLALLLTPFIAAAIRLSSPGPVLYRQERVGQDGKVFRIYKFRTMVNHAEATTGPVLAIGDDPRVTPVGRFLRMTRLDELPQILNVLRGDMSFVGPRPERPAFVEEFARSIPGYPLRLKVKPGITGLAQVRGTYHTHAMDKLLYDFYYIRNYSFLLDVRILLQTLQVILTPEKAEGQPARTQAETAVAAPLSPAGRPALLPSTLPHTGRVNETRGTA